LVIAAVLCFRSTDKANLTNADKQALLWFNIKDLFKLAGSPQRPKADYLDAIYALVSTKLRTASCLGCQLSKEKSPGLCNTSKREVLFKEEDIRPSNCLTPIEIGIGLKEGNRNERRCSRLCCEHWLRM
jgi:hypothetical protein